MNFIRNKVVVITNGDNIAAGELAVEFAMQKAQVVLVGKNKSEMKKSVEVIENHKKKVGTITAIVADLSTKKGVESALFDIKKAAGTIEILVLNNTDLLTGKIEDIKDVEIEKAIDENIKGTILLTKMALPLLKDNKKSGIISLSSFSGKVGMPFFSIQSAAAGAVRSFIEALQIESVSAKLNIMSVTIGNIKESCSDECSAKLSKLGFKFDAPSEIAVKIIDAYNDGKTNLEFGKKEKKLAGWNGFMRSTVVKDLKKIKTKILNAISSID